MEFIQKVHGFRELQLDTVTIGTAILDKHIFTYMSRWFSYNLISGGVVTETETKFGTGVLISPPSDMVEEKEYEEAFLFYVNDTTDTGAMLHLPSRNETPFKIDDGVPYTYTTNTETGEKVLQTPLFDGYSYELSLGGNYS